MKYAIGSKVYRFYSFLDEEDKQRILEGENPIQEVYIYDTLLSGTYILSSKEFSKPVGCANEDELTTSKQDLINKVKETIIEMESNIQKVKNELGIK